MSAAAAMPGGRLDVRLRRIEGQVRGLARMLDEGRTGVEILIQVAAVRAALDKVALAVLEREADGCLAAVIAGETAGKELDAKRARLLDAVALARRA